MYAELNTKSDYCQECGFDGEIQIVTSEDGKLEWECPHCGNRNQDTLNVARRTCGYMEHSSGIREEHRRSKKECFTCKISGDKQRGINESKETGCPAWYPVFLTATDYNPGMYLLALPVIHCIYRSNG